MELQETPCPWTSGSDLCPKRGHPDISNIARYKTRASDGVMSGAPSSSTELGCTDFQGPFIKSRSEERLLSVQHSASRRN